MTNDTQRQSVRARRRELAAQQAQKRAERKQRFMKAVFLIVAVIIIAFFVALAEAEESEMARAHDAEITAQAKEFWYRQNQKEYGEHIEEYKAAAAAADAAEQE
jgi:hypothetical protein